MKEERALKWADENEEANGPVDKVAMREFYKVRRPFLTLLSLQPATDVLSFCRVSATRRSRASRSRVGSAPSKATVWVPTLRPKVEWKPALPLLSPAAHPPYPLSGTKSTVSSSYPYLFTGIHCIEVVVFTLPLPATLSSLPASSYLPRGLGRATDVLGDSGQRKGLHVRGCSWPFPRFFSPSGTTCESGKEDRKKYPELHQAAENTQETTEDPERAATYGQEGR